VHRAVHALLTAQPQDAAGGVRGYCGKVLGNAAVVVGAHLLVGRCRVVVGRCRFFNWSCSFQLPNETLAGEGVAPPILHQTAPRHGEWRKCMRKRAPESPHVWVQFGGESGEQPLPQPKSRWAIENRAVSIFGTHDTDDDGDDTCVSRRGYVLDDAAVLTCYFSAQLGAYVLRVMVIMPPSRPWTVNRGQTLEDAVSLSLPAN